MSTEMVRPTCSQCGRKTRKTYPANHRGSVSILEVAGGWSVAPFPKGHVHPWGTVGDIWTCPQCNKARRA